jgi:hypothetical protein
VCRALHLSALTLICPFRSDLLFRGHPSYAINKAHVCLREQKREDGRLWQWYVARVYTKTSTLISGLGMLFESLVLCLLGVVGKFTLKAGSLLGSEQLLIVPRIVELKK